MFIHMLKFNPSNMMTSMNNEPTIIFRKKLDPCKIVTLSSLNKTDSGVVKDVDDRLVYYDGKISSDSWMPLPTKTKGIQVSSSGWDGLVSRYNKSKLQLIEVA